MSGLGVFVLATAKQQVERVIPAAREKLAEFVPALKPEASTQREVSGSDIGPVPPPSTRNSGA